MPVPVPVQVWCSKFRPEEARNRLLTDVHRCEDRQIQRAREQDTHTCTHTHMHMHMHMHMHTFKRTFKHTHPMCLSSSKRCSPAKYRVIGAVANSQEFYDAFECKAPERDMCRLW